MSNEELVVLIQGGARELLPELWAQVERFVAVQARRRLMLSGGFGGVEFGDLYNSGYLALVAAVDSYDPGADRTFISWLALALKTAFAEAGGYRSRKQALDPLHRAGDLDAPVGDDGDTTLKDFQPDPIAAQAFEAVADREQLAQLHEALEGAIAGLPPQLQAAVRGRYYRGAAVDPKAHSAALRMLRHPRVSKALRHFL